MRVHQEKVGDYKGYYPLLFWVCFEKVAGDQVSSMLLSDVDYLMMQNVYNLIRQRCMPQIERVVDQYGETYFRELIWTHLKIEII